MNGPRFHVAGFPVRIDPTFLLVVVLLGFGARSAGLLLAWVVVVTASVLLHELGHAFAFRRYGQEPEILLQGVGGLTSAPGGPLRPAHDVVVSLAGPLTGLLLLGLPALVFSRSAAGLTPTWKTVLGDIVFVNIAWSVLNLLPVLPLDGGRVAAALWSMVRRGSGMRQVHTLSVAVAAGAGLYALGRGYLFGAMFAGFFAAWNLGAISQERNAGLGADLAGGWDDLARGDAPAALAAAERVLGDRPSAEVMAHAMQLAAWAHLADDRLDDACAAVVHFPHGRLPDPALQGALELAAGRPGEALDHLVAAYAGARPGPAMPLAAAAAAGAGLTGELAGRLLAPDGPGVGAAASLAAHLHLAGRFDEAAGVGERAMSAAGPADGAARIAYNLACSHARAGRPGPALDWLERAADLGFADAPLLDADPDLNGLRGEERYRTVRARLSG